MRKWLGVVAPALALIGLPTVPAVPAHAQADPVARVVWTAPTPPEIDPPESCVVPAAELRVPCGPFRSPERSGGEACNLPAVYLGGRPGPCPERQAPPESRIIPVVRSGFSR